jgi:hypothetical protein
MMPARIVIAVSALCVLMATGWVFSEPAQTQPNRDPSEAYDKYRQLIELIDKGTTSREARPDIDRKLRDLAFSADDMITVLQGLGKGALQRHKDAAVMGQVVQLMSLKLAERHGDCSKHAAEILRATDEAPLSDVDKLPIIDVVAGAMILPPDQAIAVSAELLKIASNQRASEGLRLSAGTKAWYVLGLPSFQVVSKDPAVSSFEEKRRLDRKAAGKTYDGQELEADVASALQNGELRLIPQTCRSFTALMEQKELVRSVLQEWAQSGTKVLKRRAQNLLQGRSTPSQDLVNAVLGSTPNPNK